jgi:hypothetical protein
MQSISTIGLDIAKGWEGEQRLMQSRSIRRSGQPRRLQTDSYAQLRPVTKLTGYRCFTCYGRF